MRNHYASANSTSGSWPSVSWKVRRGRGDGVGMIYIGIRAGLALGTERILQGLGSRGGAQTSDDKLVLCW